MSQFLANVNLFCLFLVSNVPVGQFLPHRIHTDSTLIIQEGSACNYNYKAVTSVNESHFRVIFFPQQPSNDLAAAISFINHVNIIRQFVGYLHFVQIVRPNEPCPTAMFTTQGQANTSGRVLNTLYCYKRINIPLLQKTMLNCYKWLFLLHHL